MLTTMWKKYITQLYISFFYVICYIKEEDSETVRQYSFLKVFKGQITIDFWLDVLHNTFTRLRIMERDNVWDYYMMDVGREVRVWVDNTKLKHNEEKIDFTHTHYTS